MEPLTTPLKSRSEAASTTGAGNLLLMVGTTKGAFLFRSSEARAGWQASEPQFPGGSAYALAYDGREGHHRIWAGIQNPIYGCALHYSDDFGVSWTNPEIPTPQFPTDTGLSLKQIWQIVPGRAEEPSTIYCGVEPAALFESRDNGASWSLVRGLHDHPHRPQWQPGGGGLCLHTILPDPGDSNRMYIAVSSGGVYRTVDGGQSWQACNEGISAEFMPNKYPEFGQCIHKIALHPSHPKRLFLQNHGGVFRSDNGADSWVYIAKGLPDDFGFPIVMHPHEPETLYILPLERTMRCGPEAKLRPYRTRNAGDSWEPLSGGLPQQDAYETVLRDAMAADSLPSTGLYFGTRSGKLFGSRNSGDSWELIRDGLPPIVCVKAAVITGPSQTPKIGSDRSATRQNGGKPDQKLRPGA